MEFIATTIGYLFFILLSLFFFFKFKDPIHKAISGIAFFSFTLIFLIFFMLVGNVETDKICAPDVIQLSDDSVDSWEFLIANNEVHSNVWDIDFENWNNYEKAEVCFQYNNTDGSNRVNLVVSDTDLTTLSNFFYTAYVPNQTIGEECLEIDTGFMVEKVILGINCEDCSAGNQLGIGRDALTPDIKHLEATGSQSNINYSVTIEDPHVFEIKQHPNCKESVKNMTKWFWFSLFAVVLMTLMSFVWAFARDTIKDFNRK